MDVREEIERAEHVIRKAIVGACQELKEKTGLRPQEISVTMLDSGSIGDPYATEIGLVKITVGI